MFSSANIPDSMNHTLKIGPRRANLQMTGFNGHSQKVIFIVILTPTVWTYRSKGLNIPLTARGKMKDLDDLSFTSDPLLYDRYGKNLYIAHSDVPLLHGCAKTPLILTENQHSYDHTDISVNDIYHIPGQLHLEIAKTVCIMTSQSWWVLDVKMW